MLLEKNTAQALGCDKDSFFHFYNLVILHVFEMHYTVTLLPDLMQIQNKHKVILAEANVLNFNTEIFMT